MKRLLVGFALGLLIGYAAHWPKTEMVIVHHPDLSDCEDVRAAIPPGVAIMKDADGNLTWIDLRAQMSETIRTEKERRILP